jgi:HD-GYP domain-containing protein (c-di-GMP phosphodiesterase class II)
MSWLTLHHSESFPISRYDDVLRNESIRSVAVGSQDDIRKESERLNVVLIDPLLLEKGVRPHYQPGFVYVGVGLGDHTDLDSTVFLDLPAEPSSRLLRSALKRSFERVMADYRARQLESDLRDRNEELLEITKISIALSTARDHDKLIEMILQKCRELSRADAGSLYLLEDSAEGKVLKWKVAQNDSIRVDFQEMALPITKKSLAGYVALTGETLVIDDAYNLPANVEYSINTSFDQQTGYLTRSMLVIPMMTHVGDIVGVLQLINRKRVGVSQRLTAENVPEAVIPFDDHTINLIRSLGGQAAVAVENNLLYKSIERLFEGFVTASVTAIEQRDPTTSGHSFRVADLTVELARTTTGLTTGPFATATFTEDQLREIRYASLLHDFGKVGVREQVLVKAKKLYPLEMSVVQARFEYLVKAIEAEYLRKKMDFVAKHGLDGYEEESRRIDEELRSEIERVRNELQVIIQSNEPTVLPEGEFQQIQELGGREFRDASGVLQKVLTTDEVRALSIRKGNLDPAERSEIESHVTHTYQFLSKIPWTRDLRGVPDIAYAHHEKLNGRGYPRGLAGEEISLQSRMMTISDIFDALTAKDRPYKRAVPCERALDILNMEMRDGFLDKDLVTLFIDAKIYEKSGVLVP